MKAAVMSFSGLCCLLVLGKFLRVRLKVLRTLYIPSSVIAGLIGLLLLNIFPDFFQPWTAGWGKLPGFLINIVFAGLFLGVSIPPVKEVWNRCAPQLAYGQIVAWGQYLVGMGLVLFLLKPLFKVPDLFGVIVPVGFEGGHGTAGGLAPVFSKLGWESGGDLALVSATAGILSALLTGIILINWAAKRGYIHNIKSPEEAALSNGLYSPEERPEAGKQTTNPDSIETMAFHLGIIGIAVLFGLGLKETMIFLEGLLPEAYNKGVFSGFPLFPFCMIGGIFIQIFLERKTSYSPIDYPIIQRLAGLALDFLVVAAVSMIRIEVIIKDLLPLLCIISGGILWNVFCVMWLARRMLPDSWFERSIAEMGQSMGVTATGLLLLRAVDPEHKTNAQMAFGYKQLLHEPFMGGGLWTSSCVIIVALKGGMTAFIISVAAITSWLIIWKLFLKVKK